MIFPILVLLSALSISVIAAYYSIVGLTTIFSGAVLAVAIMGSALEIGKIITATWLHSNWSIVPWLMRVYLTIAVLILMFITSMGIFGYLSKSHIAQGVPMSVVQTKIEQIDFSIKQEQDNIIQEQKNILSAQRVLDQLDKSMDLYFQKGIIRRALREREKQQEERKQVQQQIIVAGDHIKNINLKIAGFTSEKFKLSQQVKGFEVEVGPIKYIAELAYGKTNTAILDKAVRWIIIMLIFVFDPLAILLILAAQISFKQYKDNKASKKDDKKTYSTFPDDNPAPMAFQSRLKEELGKKFNDKSIVEPEQFTNNLSEDDIEYARQVGDYIPGDLKNRIVLKPRKGSKYDIPNNILNNWEDEVEQDDLYVDIPVKSHTIKAKIKDDSNQKDIDNVEPDLLEEVIEHRKDLDERKKTVEEIMPDYFSDDSFVKSDGILGPSYWKKDVVVTNIYPPNNEMVPIERETKLAIPEKIAEQHKLAQQESNNVPTKVVYRPMAPSKTELGATIQDAFDKASMSPQMPYNLTSESGEYLKKLLMEELEQKLASMAKEPDKPTTS